MMSETTPVLRKQLELWHLVIGLGMAVLGGMGTAGYTYGAFRKEVDHLAEEIQGYRASTERVSSTLQDIKERMVRIETKLDDRDRRDSRPDNR